MKKIITGYFFRLFRSFEFWALMVLFLVATYYIVFPFISEENEITIARGDFILYDGDNVIVNADNVNEHRFVSSRVSAKNLYKEYGEPIPQDEYEYIREHSYFYMPEKEVITTVIERLHGVPTAVVLILIPLFFGRLFSDGTIKNLIACGHNKRQIYVASLLFSFLLNIALILVTLIFFAIICLYFKWLPPIYLPMMLVMILLEVTISCVLSSICLAVLFSSKKEVLAVITSFLLILPMIGLVIDEYGIFDSDDAYDLGEALYYVDDNAEDYEELKKLYFNEGGNIIEERFDIFEYRHRTFCKGKEYDFYKKTDINPVLKYAWMAKIYMNPYVARKMDCFGLTEYQKYRDGIYAVNLANNVIWILATSAFGLFIFKKREFK